MDAQHVREEVQLRTVIEAFISKLLIKIEIDFRRNVNKKIKICIRVGNIVSKCRVKLYF